MRLIFRDLHRVPIDASPTGRVPGRTAALVVLAGLFFAITSPFNAVTYLPFAARWAYWCALITIFAGTHLAVWQVAGANRSPWLLALCVSVLATPLVLITIVLVQRMIERPVPGVALPTLTASIWVINAALAALAVPLSARLAGPGAQGTASVDETKEPRRPDPLAGIRQRLPLKSRNEPIWALGAQDHYVDVILARSHHLVHMRLSDAVTLVAGEDGLQVHRSWWVAHDAVEEIVRRGRRVEIRLHNGQVVPVSRTGATRLKDAGWS